MGHADRELVDPGPDAADQPGRAQLLQRPPAAGDELGQVGLDLGLGLVVPEVEVVDDEEVDPWHPEPLQAVLVGPHDAVVAVVEDVVERQAAGPEARVERLRVARGLEDAADLGREDEVAPRPAVEEAAHPVLRLAAAVPGGGIGKLVERGHLIAPGLR